MLKLINYQHISPKHLTAFFTRIQREGVVGDLAALNLDPATVVSYLEHISNNRSIIGGVLVDSMDDIQGILIGAESYQWYSPMDRAFTEMILFIHPTHRRGRNFDRLFKHVQSRCIELGLTSMNIGNAMRVNPVRFERVLQHYGFNTYPVYRKEL